MSKRWTIATARQRFAELLKAAAEETSIAEAFAELRRLCEEDGYVLEPSDRHDRPDVFGRTLDELPR